jgi:YVTN family beta-propeller protein
MRRGFTRCFAAIATLAMAAGCSDDSTGPGDDTDYDGIDPIVYSQHVQPLFGASCAVAGCHTGTAPTAGLDLGSYPSLTAGSEYGSVVVPHHPERSHLYLHVSGQVPPQMPFERDPLSESAIAFLQRWIEQGAAFDDGNEMYTDVMRKGFVACQGENLVAVLDMDAATIRKGRVIRMLEVDMPHSVLVDPVGKRLYVSRLVTATDNIHVYDADTYEQVATGRAGTFPALMALSSDRTQLWITNFTGFGDSDNAVRVCNPTTLEELVPGGITPANVQQPHGLAVAPSGGFVYVTNILTDNVSVFTQSPIGHDVTVPLPLAPGGLQQPQQCVLSPAEDYLYVSALGSDRVHVMRTSDNVFVATVDVGDAPWHLTLSPDGQELWVVNWLGESVSIVNVANPEQPMVAQTLQPAHPRHPARPALERPMGIAFSPDGSLVYVTSTNDTNEGTGHHPPPDGQKHPGNVAIFDATTKTIVSVAEVPNFARFVSFLP